MEVKYKIPFSGAYAHYLSTIKILNFQLILSTQINDAQCLEWEKSLREDLKNEYSKDKKEIIKRSLLESPFFMQEEFKMSSLFSYIVTFTANTEEYFKEIIFLLLRRNSDLRKKAFSNINMSALELEDGRSIEEIKKDLFRNISLDQTKGKLFKEKFQRVSRFLNTDKSFISKNFIDSLDSIWELRNKIAHTRIEQMEYYSLKFPEKELRIGKVSGHLEYFEFVMELISLVDNVKNILEDWDKKTIEKWEVKKMIE